MANPSQSPLGRPPIGQTISDSTHSLNQPKTAAQTAAAAGELLPAQTGGKTKLPFESLALVEGKNFVFRLPEHLDSTKVGEVLCGQMQFAFNNGLVKLAEGLGKP